jgi:hypothetical protein
MEAVEGRQPGRRHDPQDRYQIADPPPVTNALEREQRLGNVDLHEPSLPSRLWRNLGLVRWI